MTWIASWQDHVKHGPAGSGAFDTEDDALTFASRMTLPGRPVCVWEYTPVEGWEETA